MQKNMGLDERILRACLAIGVLVIYLNGWISGLVAIVLGIVAVILIVTSLIGFCPLYKAIGFSPKIKK